MNEGLSRVTIIKLSQVEWSMNGGLSRVMIIKLSQVEWLMNEGLSRVVIKDQRLHLFAV